MKPKIFLEKLMLPKLIIELLRAVVYYWVPIYIYRTFINLFLALFLGKTELGAFIFYTALHIYYPATVRSMVCAK